MVRVILVRPGATEFDVQRRIKGCLDIPLSDSGKAQVVRTVAELAEVPLTAIYSAPCESARETAEALARTHALKFKTVECFRNIDHGLWHGKLIDELRRQMPRMFRQGQDLAESVSPPGGETIADARKRVCKALKKIFKKAEDDVVALVIPDPLASVIASMMQGKALEDLWEAECDGGKWESLDVAGALAMV